jgi:putative FmdB family regulatory protein
VPTYQYVCTECGGQLEAVQKFTDESLTVHDDCGGRLRKVFSPVGIVFKGSGFYRTDSRKSDSSASVPSASKAGSDSAASSFFFRRLVGVLVEVGRRLVRVVVLFRQLRVVVFFW